MPLMASLRLGGKVDVEGDALGQPLVEYLLGYFADVFLGVREVGIVRESRRAKSQIAGVPSMAPSIAADIVPE